MLRFVEYEVKLVRISSFIIRTNAWCSEKAMLCYTAFAFCNLSYIHGRGMWLIYELQFEAIPDHGMTAVVEGKTVS